MIERAGEEEILQVADRDNDGIADPDVIAAALETADRRIEFYLARYRLPLTSVPPIVVGWAVSIARYVLHRQGPPDYVVRDYKDANAELEKVAAGRLTVPDAEGNTPPPSSVGGVTAEGSEPQFTRDKLEGFL